MIYEPREDSFLLQKFVKKFAKGRCLDMGTGSGIQAETAAAKCTKVIGVDKSDKAVDFCRHNVKNKKVKFYQSDLFTIFQKNKKFANMKFDTIIFNPPYLPMDHREPRDSRLHTTGGKKGHEILEDFLQEANNFLDTKGKILILFSSLTKKDKVEEIITENLFEFKRLGKKKYSFEELYVYLVEKSVLLKKLEMAKVKDIRYYAHGHRGVVYKALYKNKPVAVKVEGKTKAVNRIANETKWLRKLNKYGIGPKLLLANKNFIVMEFVEGKEIFEYMQHAARNQIRNMIKEILEQCYKMDKMKVNKEEMHHPVKHILISDRPVMIDFERCRNLLKPQNVTQFCQFLTSGNFSYGLENIGLHIDRKVLTFAKKYKHEMNRKNFESILNEI